MLNEPSQKEVERYKRQALEYAKKARSAAIPTQAVPEEPTPLPAETVTPEPVENTVGNVPQANIQGLASLTPERYAAFSERYPGRGTLKVQVFTAGGIFPIANAAINIDLLLDGVRYALFNGTTDNSGIVDNIVLPARPLSASQNVATAGDSGAVYLASIYHPSFKAVVDQPITAYDGVETLLPVELLPLMQEVKS